RAAAAAAAGARSGRAVGSGGAIARDPLASAQPAGNDDGSVDARRARDAGTPVESRGALRPTREDAGAALAARAAGRNAGAGESVRTSLAARAEARSRAHATRAAPRVRGAGATAGARATVHIAVASRSPVLPIGAVRSRVSRAPRESLAGDKATTGERERSTAPDQERHRARTGAGRIGRIELHPGNARVPEAHEYRTLCIRQHGGKPVARPGVGIKATFQGELRSDP